MHRGIIVYIVIIIIIAAVAYYETGFRSVLTQNTSTIIPSNNPHSTTTTITGSKSTTTLIPFVSSCSNVTLTSRLLNASTSVQCQWAGGLLGVWVASGPSASEHLTVLGADGKLYVNQTASYCQPTFFQNFTAPKQRYQVTLTTSGDVSSSCLSTWAYGIINTTTNPPQNKVYTNVYNGNFSSGTYAGWNATGPGFGTAPFNITYGNSKQCYLGQPWSGYTGNYFATTYNCGLTNAAGNITSSPFIVNGTKPFLNFKLISPADANIYITILSNGKRAITAYYNTYNYSASTNPASTFQNASIPLATLSGKPVQVRVVAQELKKQTFIAAGDFALSNKPKQQQGIITNLTFNQS
ncbi:MAG: hypothetical protein KGH60_04485 [Candidatus Micrarchaeota archaeon]|nr:hypothetical protein [Candidatus Micrarchaeota archaeon]